MNACHPRSLSSVVKFTHFRLTARPLHSEAMTRPSFGDELRYVGRDGLTGMAARVDDRFIAEVEHAIERYGKDASQPVPPPSPGPVDVAALTIAKLGLSRVRVG